MKKIIKWIREKWHNDLQEKNLEILRNQTEIIQDLQKAIKNILVNQAWVLFQSHNLDYFVKNKTWFASYKNYDEFQSDKHIQEQVNNTYSLTKNYYPPYIKAYCEVCNKFTVMSFDCSYASQSEAYCCCGMNSRTRGMYEYITTHFQNDKKVYIQEAVTPSYKAYENFFGHDNILGSEYLGQDKICGEYYDYNGQRIMHQDCTKLSFNDNTFDLLISQQIFEHIFDIKTALSESLRVLRDDGCIVISIPFFYDTENSVMLAKLDESGKIVQIVKPSEIHGNPISRNGSLVFWHHGWEFTEIMKDVGYKDVKVHFYNNLYKGYLGLASIITGIKKQGISSKAFQKTRCVTN